MRRPGGPGSASGRGRDGALPPWPAWDPTRDDADKYLVLDTAQDRGIRMASETESSAALFAELARDPGIGPAERCAILGELIRARPGAAERSGAAPCAPERIVGGD